MSVSPFVQARMEEAKSLFRNAETTQFIIVTIPTVMAAAESARLADALRKEGVPVQLMVINQVRQTSSSYACFVPGKNLWQLYECCVDTGS